MIDFSRALGLAWERMIIILFRGSDFQKWLIIGFNAFLVLLSENGVSINNSFPMNGNFRNQEHTYETLSAVLHAFKQALAYLESMIFSPWVALYIAAAAVYVLIWLAANWAGCRGQFMFLDNVVRNRGAIAVPWKQYAREGNTWFLVHLGLVMVSLVFWAVAAGGFLALNWSWINGERAPKGSEVAMVVSYSCVVFVLLAIYGAFNFLIRSFVLSLYFKKTMGLGKAFLAVGHLMVTRPLDIAAYLVVSFLLAVMAAILTLVIVGVTCCLICWVACIPCLGSTLLSVLVCQLILPIIVYLRCFQLDCLAQFGPEYDVWTVDVAPAVNLPPQLG